LNECDSDTVPILIFFRKGSVSFAINYHLITILMSESFPSPRVEVATPSLHPALYGPEALSGTVPTILVCPLPLPGLSHEQLLPELSHELKTPLTGIMGLAQVLQRNSGPLADREYQYADLIYQRSQQLLVSINDLFDLAQICTHQFVLQLRPIELSSVVNTALKIAKYTALSGLFGVISSHSLDEETELWMMGDLPRVEQLLTHLIGYFAVQGVPESQPTLKLSSHHSWLSITLVGTLQAESIPAQTHLSCPYPHLESSASTMPGRSGTVLKFLLAKQLTQLHGGDVSWRRKASLETEVTVLLPRDLTQATLFTRLGLPQPLLLIYAPHLPEADDLIEHLQAQNVLGVIARSLDEVSEKVKILSPSNLVLDGNCTKTPEWTEIETLLRETSVFHPIEIIWLQTPPKLNENAQTQASEVWSLPFVSEQIAQTLQQTQKRAKRFWSNSIAMSQPPIDDLPAQSARLLTVLQIDQVLLSSSEAVFAEILTYLSGNFGCSILAVDNLEQAELLAQIWQPKIIICPGTLPKWATNCPQTSVLVQLPLFVLALTNHQTTIPSTHLNYQKTYFVSPNASVQSAAQQLYQQLMAAAKFYSPSPPSPG
jgi:hypothetical protein